ncbi:MAG TPA: TonB-dependent receptor [Phnomibacter sp.]|nr:TonB-dependent receptor [Phnomibacter sp.]
MKKICAFLLLFLPTCLLAQSIRLSVKQPNGDVLAGASVILKSSKTFFGSTNESGVAKMNVAGNGTHQLLVSFTGFQTIDTSININAAAQIDLVMQPLQASLLPVEIKSNRANDKAPFTKTDLTKTFIEKNNLGQDIPMLLNQTANVVVNSDAGNGVGYTGIRIRGSDASRINMTINGIPYNDPESQGLFFVNLPDLLSSVSSIQVQRGVGTSSNGAGAFGATMNFSTHSYNPEAYAELNNSIGSFGTYKNTIKGGSGLIGKHFTIDARLSNIHSDGYVDRASSDLQSGQFTVGYWADKSSIRFIAILGKEKTYQSWNGISQSDLKNNRTYNSAGTEKPGEPYDNETDNYWQNHYQLFFTHEFNKYVVFNTALYLTTGRGYYEQYKADEDLADYGIPPLNDGSGAVTSSDLVRRLWLKNKLFGQVASLQVNKGRTEWTFGGGWSYYPGQHFGEVIWTEAQPSYYTKYYHYDAKKTDANVYAKWLHKLNNEHWKLFADVQFRHANYQIEGFRNNPGVTVDEQWNFINPKAGITYNTKNWSAYFSYAIGNKEPNRDDFEAGITQQPVREQLHDLELNITNKAVTKNLQIGATFYYMYYLDQLVLTGKVNDVGAYTRSNIPQSYRAGAELEATLRYNKGAIKYSGAFSISKLKDFTEYIDNYDDPNYEQIVVHHGNTPIAFSPTVVQFLSATYQPFKNTEIEWMAKHVGKQFLDNTGNDMRSLDPFINNDARISYRFAAKKILKEARLIFQVNNVFNSEYEPNGYTFSYQYGGSVTTENYYYPMAGRNWMLALNIRL